MITANLAGHLQRFFTDRLMGQLGASAHTVASYRDTFRLLLHFATKRLQCQPSQLRLGQIDVPFLNAFFKHLEQDRCNPWSSSPPKRRKPSSKLRIPRPGLAAATKPSCGWPCRPGCAMRRSPRSGARMSNWARVLTSAASARAASSAARLCAPTWRRTLDNGCWSNQQSQPRRSFQRLAATPSAPMPCSDWSPDIGNRPRRFAPRSKPNMSRPIRCVTRRPWNFCAAGSI